MKLVVTGVSVAGPHEPLVPATTFTALPAEVTVVTGDPGPMMTALALAIGGRVPVRRGHVELWGEAGRGYLQEHVALVDVEDVTSPEESLPVSAVLREQLALAGQPSRKRHVRDFLEAHGVEDTSGRWELVPSATRTEMLLDLAALRPGTQVVVLCGPDRHGGDALDWYAAAQRTAARVFTVVALCTTESATHVGVSDPIRIGTAGVRG